MTSTDGYYMMPQKPLSEKPAQNGVKAKEDIPEKRRFSLRSKERELSS